MAMVICGGSGKQLQHKTKITTCKKCGKLVRVTATGKVMQHSPQLIRKLGKVVSIRDPGI